MLPLCWTLNHLLSVTLRTTNGSHRTSWNSTCSLLLCSNLLLYIFWLRAVRTLRWPSVFFYTILKIVKRLIVFVQHSLPHVAIIAVCSLSSCRGEVAVFATNYFEFWRLITTTNSYCLFLIFARLQVLINNCDFEIKALELVIIIISVIVLARYSFGHGRGFTT